MQAEDASTMGGELSQASRQETISQLNQQAVNLFLLGRADDAIRLCQEVLRLVENQPQAAGDALQTIGRVCLSQSQYGQALHYFQQAREQFEAGGCPRCVAICSSYAGVALAFLGDYAGCIETLRQAVQLAQQQGDESLEAEILNDLSYTYIELRQPEMALLNLERSIRILREQKKEMELSWALDTLGHAHRLLGNIPQALDCTLEAMALARKNQNWVDISRFSHSAGEVYLAAGDLDHAVETFQEELRLSRERGFRGDECHALISLAKASRQEGRLSGALDLLLQAEGIARETGLRPEEKDCCELLAQLFKEREDYRLALEYYTRFHEIDKALFNSEADQRLKNLQVLHQVETARKEAEIYQLRAQTLQQEVDERRQTQEVLEELARTDPLTGILNRRGFFEVAEPALEASHQNLEPLSAILVDVDHFKLVNDQFGHQVGDRVLALIAERLRNHIRGTDYLARMGGEEFIVLLPGAGPNQARSLAERLRQALIAYPVKSGDAVIQVTLSLGVATIEPGSTLRGIDELIGLADSAMYRAKNAGRNAVASYSFDN